VIQLFIKRKGIRTMQKRDEKVVQLCTTRDLVQYTMYKEALENAGIDCMDTPHVDSAYDDLFVPAQGYADIYVFESDKNAALGVIEKLKQEDLGPHEE